MNQERKFMSGIVVIIIIDVLMASTITSAQGQAQQQAATTFLTYKDPKGTFTINYPNDWTAKPGNRFDGYLVTFNGPSAFFGIMEPIARHNDPSSLKDVLDQFSLAVSPPNFKRVEDVRCDKYVMMDGSEVCSLLFTKTVSYLDTTKIVTLMVVSEHEGNVYFLRYEALPDNFDSILPTVEKMITSFKILTNTTG